MLDLILDLYHVDATLCPVLKHCGSSWLEPRVCGQVFVEKKVLGIPKLIWFNLCRANIGEISQKTHLISKLSLVPEAAKSNYNN